MATSNKNSKSQLFTVRVPHDLVTDMENLKTDGESNAGFIVAAMQGEIERRQLKESDENKLISNLASALASLAQIEEIGTKAGEDIKAIIEIARQKTKAETPDE